MRTLALTVRQLRYEQKVFWRNPPALTFSIGFPVVLLVIFSSLNFNEILSLLGGIRYTQYYVPSMAAFGIMSSCFANLAGHFVFRRESGQLKRFKATPVPLTALIGGFLLNAIVVATLVTAAQIAVGVTFYDVQVPHRWAAFAVVLLVGAFSFCALGVAFSILVPNQDAIQPMIFGAFMPIVFISGAFFPVRADSVLARIASFFPVRHLIEATFQSFDPRVTGTGIAWKDLAIVGAWGVGAALFAQGRFRWEPSRS